MKNKHFSFNQTLFILQGKKTTKNKSWLVSKLVDALSPVNHKKIVSGLRETFIRDVVERTNKAETRPEEQNEKAESCQENLWNAKQLKRAIKTEKDTRTE